jgi:hypothetical protein
MTFRTPDHRIVHHHVGGRGGSTGFGVPKEFEADFLRVLYDADEGSLARAEETLSGQGAGNVVLPYFIGRPGRTVDFHINYCPFTSSSRRVLARFRDHYQLVDGTDYVLGEACAPIRTVELRSYGLDELTLGPGARLPPPDLLSIDTEGTEDDVLAGASRLVESHVVAVDSEVRFQRVLDGGPTFGEITRLLEDRGFLFVDFEYLGRIAPMRGRLGSRGLGMVSFSDAIYFKDPRIIAETWGDRAGPALRKLAFIALGRAQLEFAQLCLALAPPMPANLDPPPRYLKLLAEFGRLCEELPDLRPWSFVDAYSAEASAARSSALPAHEADRVAAASRRRALEESRTIEAQRAAFERAREASALVELLRRHGFDLVAQVVAKVQADTVAEYVGGAVRMASSDLHRRP